MSDLELFERTQSALLAAESESIEHTAKALRSALASLAMIHPKIGFSSHHLTIEPADEEFEERGSKSLMDHPICNQFSRKA